MAFRITHVLRYLMTTNSRSVKKKIFRNLVIYNYHNCVQCLPLHNSTVVYADITKKLKDDHKNKDLAENLFYLSDPDTFGLLSNAKQEERAKIEDEGDKKEEEFLHNIPMRSQQLSTKQYADIMKVHIQHKRIKEAIDVMEIKMIKEDRVKPENYIYNILIGACADVGYTKKALSLFNDMKKRGLKVTGATYTCLFNACANSPWTADGISRAKQLRQLMSEKRIEPNLTNYNAMIKAFGRCGDLSTAFEIVDEMSAKKIDIRVHTFNFLLQACISDKDNGLRHALLVWRKLLEKREKPNIYSFNLMLRCVKDCGLGNMSDTQEVIDYIMSSESLIKLQSPPTKGILTVKNVELINRNETYKIIGNKSTIPLSINSEDNTQINFETDHHVNLEKGKSSVNESSQDSFISIDLSQTSPSKLQTLQSNLEADHKVTNLIAREPQMGEIISLNDIEVNKPQDKFALIGGQTGFIKEMATYSVIPQVKTLIQMLPLIPDTVEAENSLMELFANYKLYADIDFYNALIRKRCLRKDYQSAKDVLGIIRTENKIRKKKHFLKKELQLESNILTYGALALSCSTQEEGMQLIKDMREAKLKLNIQILGTLLRHGTSDSKFSYILYIMEIVREENIPPNEFFLRHLEKFNTKCQNILKTVPGKAPKYTEQFLNSYKIFARRYRQWLVQVNASDVTKDEHPWSQFRENQPELVQRLHEETKGKRIYKKRSIQPRPYRVPL